MFHPFNSIYVILGVTVWACVLFGQGGVCVSRGGGFVENGVFCCGSGSCSSHYLFCGTIEMVVNVGARQKALVTIRVEI